MKLKKLLRVIASSIVTISLLSACGGGGDSSPTGASIVEQPKNLSFSDTVAVGAALSNAVVQVQCGEVKASSGPTDISGNYAVNLMAELPCKFEAVELKTRFLLRLLAKAGSLSLPKTQCWQK